MAKTKFCQGISDISDTYMGFIIDLWGVIHDGDKAYEGVADCLKELKNRKKFIILLSNSGMRADAIKAQLKKMGVGPSLYSMIVTSGEMVLQGLSAQEEGPFKNIGKKCFLFNKLEDPSVLSDAGVDVVDDVKEADFLLIGGANALLKPMEEYEPILKEAVRRGLKAICMNPDSRALLSAAYVMGPGLIARRYEDFGGVVHYIGKPHQPIFNKCMVAMQAQDIFRAQIVIVGDTMAHDIMGGWAASIDSCLVRGGLHASNFRHVTNAAEMDKALNILVSLYNSVKPNYLVNRLQWGRALPDRKHKIHKKRKTTGRRSRKTTS